MDANYHVAEWAYVIEDDFVEKTCPDEWKDLEEVLTKHGIGLDDLAQFLEYELESLYDITKEELEDAKNAYDELIRQFKMKTSFSIKLRYHDNEEYGSENDSITENFFAVDYTEIVLLNPVAKKIGMEVKLKDWVTDAQHQLEWR